MLNDKETIALLVRALHAANSGGVRGNPYLVHRDALTAAGIALGGDAETWPDFAGPSCVAAPLDKAGAV